MAKPKVIVVDDSNMTRKFYSYVLTSSGYTVKEAEDGYEAMEYLLCESFDLIITDINMPRMDGFEFIREVRQLPEYANKPIIIVSSQDYQQDIEKGLVLGANSYFAKPTEAKIMINQVRSLLQRPAEEVE